MHRGTAFYLVGGRVAEANNGGDVSDDPLTTQLLDFFTKNIVPAVEEASRKQTAATAKAYLDEAEKARAALEEAYKKSLDAVDKQAAKLVAAEKALSDAAEDYRVRAEGFATRAKQDSDAQVDKINQAATTALESLRVQAETLAQTKTATLSSKILADQADRIVAEVLSRLKAQDLVTPAPPPAPVRALADPPAESEPGLPNAVIVKGRPNLDDEEKAPSDWKKWLPTSNQALIGGGIIAFLLFAALAFMILAPLFGVSMGTQTDNSALEIPPAQVEAERIEAEAAERQRLLTAAMVRLNAASAGKLAFCNKAVCPTVDALRALPADVRTSALTKAVQVAINLHLAGTECAKPAPAPTPIGVDGRWGGQARAALTRICLPRPPISLDSDTPAEADLDSYLQTLLLALPKTP